MEAEYAFNYRLSRRGLRVPEILGADTKSRSILFSFIPGDGLSTLLVKLAQSSQTGQREKEAARFQTVSISRAMISDTSDKELQECALQRRISSPRTLL